MQSIRVSTHRGGRGRRHAAHRRRRPSGGRAGPDDSTLTASVSPNHSENLKPRDADHAHGRRHAHQPASSRWHLDQKTRRSTSRPASATERQACSRRAASRSCERAPQRAQRLPEGLEDRQRRRHRHRRRRSASPRRGRLTLFNGPGGSSVTFNVNASITPALINDTFEAPLVKKHGKYGYVLTLNAPARPAGRSSTAPIVVQKIHVTTGATTSGQRREARLHRGRQVPEERQGAVPRPVLLQRRHERTTDSQVKFTARSDRHAAGERLRSKTVAREGAPPFPFCTDLFTIRRCTLIASHASSSPRSRQCWSWRPPPPRRAARRSSSPSRSRRARTSSPVSRSR